MPRSAKDPRKEVLEVKKWLRRLREERGYTQEQLATVMGVDPRSVMNAENEDPKHGLPRGLPFLRLLQELGAVVDAPEPKESPLLARLRSLEEKVEALPTAEDQARSHAAVLEAIRSRPNQGTGESGEAARG